MMAKFYSCTSQVFCSALLSPRFRLLGSEHGLVTEQANQQAAHQGARPQAKKGQAFHQCPGPPAPRYFSLPLIGRRLRARRNLKQHTTRALPLGFPFSDCRLALLRMRGNGTGLPLFRTRALLRRPWRPRGPMADSEACSFSVCKLSNSRAKRGPGVWGRRPQELPVLRSSRS